MFEEGARLKAIHGAENVFDFSLGNPDLPTPDRVRERLARIVAEGDGAEHGYMNNAGFWECRVAIAARESRKSGKAIDPEGVIMTVGAAGALCVIFKAILNPGEEVITISPTLVNIVLISKTTVGRWSTFPPPVLIFSWTWTRCWRRSRRAPRRF